MQAPPPSHLNKKVQTAYLAQLLQRFFQPRTLDYKCSECDCTTVEVAGKMKALPRVLVLHLKRFLPNLAKGTYEKIRDRVRFPAHLDLSGVCTPQTLNPPAVTVEKTLQRASRASRNPSTLNAHLGYPELRQPVKGECTSQADLEKLMQELEDDQTKLAKFRKKLTMVFHRDIDPRKDEQQQLSDCLKLSEMESAVVSARRFWLVTCVVVC